MVVRDDSGKEYEPSSFLGFVFAMQYTLLLGLAFGVVEAGVLVGVPLYAILEFGFGVEGAYGMSLLASFIIPFGTFSERGVIPNKNATHVIPPWPNWIRIDVFIKNWVAVVFDDGVLRLFVYYWAVLGSVAGSAFVLFQFDAPSLVVSLASGVVLIRVWELYEVDSLWVREEC